MIKTYKDNQGYLRNTKSDIHIHRIKLKTFINIFKDLFNEKMVVHHKDGNRLNNITSNLELITQSKHCTLHHKYKTKKRKRKFPYAVYRGNKGKHLNLYLWRSRITYKGKRIHLGDFKDPYSASLIAKLVLEELKC